MPSTQINGVNMFFELKGHGATLVFIHPPVLPSEIFRFQLKQLSKHYQILLFDIRGHGYSSPSPTEWNFSDIAKDLKQLLDQLNIRHVWICGYSAGASIAFEFTHLFPEKVKGLIQIGPVPAVNDLLLKGMVKIAMNAAAKNKIPLISYVGAMLNTNTLRLFFSLLKTAKMTNANDAACFYRSYYKFQCMAYLADIHQPVLLIYGKEDKVFGKYAESLTHLLPNYTLTFIEKAKHEVPGNFYHDLNHLIRNFIV
ncbi:alpha/beta fold hydrolase [Heyndrickxia ginsengihumi]|uniref:Alpha/beta hydrolase n=1 Tax=Heyndrickxia ginsengihumi TaxID=363870 RepID=A0A0A6XVK1_9BACI|nr:alpha/beta hydrolase [Heyndrickxia ginsengihumi]KHD84212.1 hypothetical protein NG54_16995 [Heyndrickxia ginsengihumi]MBE6184051.1 alpha/beta hydrolase [Bacillus sp. (in: firmicutes)]MCM3024572.1 alpha/beta hydrolase [Heyndrickxia ginsengihumi]NEY18781.1 alpha/beta hydrolase [Heyndrickxia ginsengihumi]